MRRQHKADDRAGGCVLVLMRVLVRTPVHVLVRVLMRVLVTSDR